MVLIIAMVMLLVTLLIFINLWLPTLSQDMEKLSPYECGFDPTGSAHWTGSINKKYPWTHSMWSVSTGQLPEEMLKDKKT